MGADNCVVAELQRFLCRNGSDRWTGDASFQYGRSTANQRIESYWSVLRKEYGQFWISIFQQLKEDGDFDGTDVDKELVRFCFLPLIQVMCLMECLSMISELFSLFLY